MNDPAFFGQPEYVLFRRAFAEKKVPLVIVCGSGLSAPASLPTWPALRGLLQGDADRKVAALGAIGQQLTADRARRIKTQDDLWVAFKLLRELLTPPVYDQLIEQYLSPPADSEVPAGYLNALRLEPRGIVTLNLDKFAGEALATRHPGELVTPIFGSELAQKWNRLELAKTFLVYLHGGLHDPSTWVLTQDELSSLTQSVGHQHFLRYLYTEHLVLFLGISADDDALSGRLIELVDAGFKPRNLYWFTNRTDTGVANLSSRGYVSVIQYAARSNAEHNLALTSLVDDCLRFKSLDQPEAPLIGGGVRFASEAAREPLDPDELAQAAPEEIRRTVASRLDQLLTDEEDARSTFDKYRDFCYNYDFAVHRAFYRAKSDKYRSWFGYRLQFPALGRGNFGEVYAADAPDGETVAVKIMHESIFGNDDMLGGFRRGVRSMQFVSENNVEGMVPIKASYELPPTIVMPFVSGHSLQEALSIRPDLDWIAKLKIGIQVGQIVGRGHALPQTILHRDLKPSNIMITNLEYSGPFDPAVVVLDFDMSWHKGSKEKDVVFESRDDFGFLAPEQTDASNRYTARSTRVDSYGLGMTLFYLFGQEAPRPNEALSELWLERAMRATERGFSGSWRSAPSRLGRLVAQLTQIDQNLRTDFATATHALEALLDVLVDHTDAGSPEMWAEEILNQVSEGQGYEWNDSVGRGMLSSPTGIGMELYGNYRSDSVVIEVRYTDRGMRERGHLGKYLGNAVTNSNRDLKAAGWHVLEHRSGSGEAVVRAEASISQLREGYQVFIDAAKQTLGYFRF